MPPLSLYPSTENCSVSSLKIEEGQGNGRPRETSSNVGNSINSNLEQAPLLSVTKLVITAAHFNINEVSFIPGFKFQCNISVELH